MNLGVVSLSSDIFVMTGQDYDISVEISKDSRCLFFLFLLLFLSLFRPQVSPSTLRLYSISQRIDVNIFQIPVLFSRTYDQ